MVFKGIIKWYCHGVLYIPVMKDSKMKTTFKLSFMMFVGGGLSGALVHYLALYFK